eukprot:1063948-Pelagomonas_calceolata.AAC.5
MHLHTPYTGVSAYQTSTWGGGGSISRPAPTESTQLVRLSMCTAYKHTRHSACAHLAAYKHTRPDAWTHSNTGLILSVLLCTLTLSTTVLRYS